VIVEIRRIRNEYKVDQKKKVTVTISAPAEKLSLLRENQSTIELLATSKISDGHLQSMYVAPQETSVLSDANGFQKKVITNLLKRVYRHGKLHPRTPFALRKKDARSRKKTARRDQRAESLRNFLKDCRIHLR